MPNNDGQPKKLNEIIDEIHEIITDQGLDDDLALSMEEEEYQVPVQIHLPDGLLYDVVKVDSREDGRAVVLSLAPLGHKQ